MESLSRQVEAFFGGKEMADFKEVYGGGNDQPAETQIEARNKVLEMADALMYGAKAQGRNLSLNKALELAHDSVSGGFKEQAIRSKIKGSLQARAKGIILRPTSKSQTAANRGKVKTRGDLEKRVGASLAALFPQS